LSEKPNALFPKTIIILSVKEDQSMVGKRWMRIGLSAIVFFCTLPIVSTVLAADAPAWNASIKKFKNLNTYKQEVIADKGVVSTDHALSSAAGIQIMAKGGNAVDAMIACFFTTSVVEPWMMSPFGAGFINIYSKDGKSTTLDNYTVAPAAAKPDMFKLAHPDDEEKQAMTDHLTVGAENDYGPKAVAVPGNMKAWLWVLKNYGSRNLTLREIMQPAIDHAKNGFRLTVSTATKIKTLEKTRSQFPGWVAEFMPEGKPPAAGSLLKRPAYAVTLEAIADAAPAGASFDEQLEAAGTRFYKGDIAKNITSYLQEKGGILAMDDLAWYYGNGLDDISENQGLRLREPVRGTYRGYDIIALAPASSGGTHIVEMLNILEGFDLKKLGFGNPKTLHLMTETMKIAWADRNTYMGDPEYGHKDPSSKYDPPPVKELIDKKYAAERRREIKQNQVGTYKAGVFKKTASVQDTAPLQLASYESSNTTNGVALDDQGNIITMTQTVNFFFGAGIIVPGQVPGSGMTLNNCMMLFDPDPRPGFERANAIAPRKRTLSSMAPTVVLKDGKPFMALGTHGGVRIFSSVMQAIINVIDHGMTLQQAVEAPRIWTSMLSELNVEEGFPEEVVKALKDMGHTIKRVKMVGAEITSAQRNPKTGKIHGAVCWRGDGTSVGWSGGPELDAKLPYPPIWDTPKK
jgi:gamma-glutamyltranspeptidase / glutathione hydrolase